MSYAKARVLVVEDQKFTRMVLIDQLRTLGFSTISEAEDGADALKLLERYPFDLILLDIEMEPIDGLTFLSAFRNMNLVHPPKVIVLTSHSETDIVFKVRSLGVDGFLLKPVQSPALAKRIDYVLRPKAQAV